jgi:hypothetical protein
MSTEGILGTRKLRVIERATGIIPERGWAWHPVWEFRDSSDQHYAFHPKTGHWEQLESPRHYSSCLVAGGGREAPDA